MAMLDLSRIEVERFHACSKPCAEAFRRRRRSSAGQTLQRDDRNCTLAVGPPFRLGTGLNEGVPVPLQPRSRPGARRRRSAAREALMREPNRFDSPLRSGYDARPIGRILWPSRPAVGESRAGDRTQPNAQPSRDRERPPLTAAVPSPRVDRRPRCGRWPERAWRISSVRQGGAAAGGLRGSHRNLRTTRLHRRRPVAPLRVVGGSERRPPRPARSLVAPPDRRPRPGVRRG